MKASGRSSSPQADRTSEDSFRDFAPFSNENVSSDSTPTPAPLAQVFCLDTASLHSAEVGFGRPFSRHVFDLSRDCCDVGQQLRDLDRHLAEAGVVVLEAGAEDDAPPVQFPRFLEHIQKHYLGLSGKVKRELFLPAGADAGVDEGYVDGVVGKQILHLRENKLPDGVAVRSFAWFHEMAGAVFKLVEILAPEGCWADGARVTEGRMRGGGGGRTGGTETLMTVFEYELRRHQGAVMCEGHVDRGFLTVVSNESGGLEVKVDGKWVRVPKTGPSGVVILVGHALDAATGGRYPAAEHRIVQPEGGVRRISIAFKIRPDGKVPFYERLMRDFEQNHVSVNRAAPLPIPLAALSVSSAPLPSRNGSPDGLFGMKNAFFPSQRLATEVECRILSFLDLKDIVRLGQVCRGSVAALGEYAQTSGGDDKFLLYCAGRNFPWQRRAFGESWPDFCRTWARTFVQWKGQTVLASCHQHYSRQRVVASAPPDAVNNMHKPMLTDVVWRAFRHVREWMTADRGSRHPFASIVDPGFFRRLHYRSTTLRLPPLGVQDVMIHDPPSCGCRGPRDGGGNSTVAAGGAASSRAVVGGVNNATGAPCEQAQICYRHPVDFEDVSCAEAVCLFGRKDGLPAYWGEVDAALREASDGYREHALIQFQFRLLGD